MAFLDDNELVFVSYYAPSHKIWGWFRSQHRNESRAMRAYNTELHAFWAVVGKTISIKRHRWSNNLNRVRDKKAAGKYEEISADRLLELWPTFYDDMEQHMVYIALSGGLDE